jgi:hypothetical protein
MESLFMRYLAIASLTLLAIALPLSAENAPLDTIGGTTADQMLNDMLKPPPPTTAPSNPALQSFSPSPASNAPAHLLREGSDVVERIGHIHKRGDGFYDQIIFDDHGPALPPLYAMPNLRLMQMEDATAAANRDLHFTISGTVFEYDGNNYILLDTGPAEIVQSISAAVAPHPATRPASADQMLTDMLANDARPSAATERRPTLAVDKTTGDGAVAPDAPVLNVLREQSQIIDRVARMTDTADGQFRQLVFDADGSSLRDPPLIILPNLKLAAMQGVISSALHDPRFRCSGMVTEYRGRNYIILEKVVVVPDSAEQF